MRSLFKTEDSHGNSFHRPITSLQMTPLITHSHLKKKSEYVRLRPLTYISS